MEPVERLLNLVALLLEAGKPVSFDRIRELLPEAYGHEDSESAKRMFERDKDLLRDYGVPLKMEATDIWEAEQGYVIRKDEYYLPEISFSPEEMAALFVAAKTGGQDVPAEQAVRKLLYGADGGVLAGAADGPLAAGPDTPSSRLLAAADAAQRSRRLRFGYRTSKGAVSDRQVDAYAMLCRGGHWYLVGMDADRLEIRAFRLSRFTQEPVDVGEGSEPPEGFRAADHVRAGPWGMGEPAERARIRFSPEVAWWAAAGLQGGAAEPVGPDGWQVLSVPLADEPALAAWVLQFGPDARVIEPESLRAEVVHRLEQILA